ncbi:hypothetical protein Tco_0845311 [Tanacetum coccineum]
MDTTRAEQISLDDAFVAPANHLKIGKSNFRLSSDLKSKEATLQVVYDVLKLAPFYKAFQISANVPEIYMQEFWATATVHHHSIRFKMNNKKHIVNIEHEDTQLYGAILPNELTNEDIRNSESYKEYYAIAFGAKPPKTKASVKKKKVGSDKTTTPPKGKRLKTSAKIAKPTKKKQLAKTSMDKGLIVLSEVALTEAEKLKLVIERSKTQTYISYASGSGADKGTSSLPGVPDVPTYDSDDEQISWKSSEEDNDDEVNVSEDDDTDNDDDDNDDYVEKDINDNDADNQDKDDQDAKI